MEVEPEAAGLGAVTLGTVALGAAGLGAVAFGAVALGSASRLVGRHFDIVWKENGSLLDFWIVSLMHLYCV